MGCLEEPFLLSRVLCAALQKRTSDGLRKIIFWFEEEPFLLSRVLCAALQKRTSDGLRKIIFWFEEERL